MRSATIHAFVRLSRVKFLAGGIAGGLLGTSIAIYEGAPFAWSRYLAAQATITAFHLMTHYANDYFDREADRTARRTPFSGGSGTLVDGSLPAYVAARAAACCALAGLAGAATLWTLVRAPAAAACALAIGVLAWEYSAPPLRFCRRGWGESVTALIVGVLVPLCAYAAQGGAGGLRVLASCLPGAAAMVAMMLAVECPDRAADAAAHKRNLVVRLQPGGTRILGACAAAMVYVAAAAALPAGAPPGSAILQALSLPLAAGYAASLGGSWASDASAARGVAARGVALSFIVVMYGALGYAAAAFTRR